MSVSFETTFSYKGNWGWYIGGVLLEGGDVVDGARNGISVEIQVFCF